MLLPLSVFKLMATPRLLRFIIMNAADSPSISGGRVRRVSSPPGTFSTLMTSAPMSASINPHTGPAMMCANSMTFKPARGPTSAAGELGLFLFEKSLQTDLEVPGAEAEKTLVDLVSGKRRGATAPV